ncbi:MAG: hypothetical protein HY318_08000 [Armatimonadetes bacterium]|nr:hypothetical protein [Armatimonadota bacterium]
MSSQRLGMYLLCGAFSLLVTASLSAQKAADTRAASRSGEKTSLATVLLEDFEAGIGKWVANDINKQEGHAEVLLCEILSTKPGAPEGSKGQAATLTFKRASDSWASLSIPVDGIRWREKSVTQLSFWLKGDGSDNDIEIMLRSVSATGEEQKFGVIQSLSESRWHKVTLPLRLFRSGSHTAEQYAPELYLLQFVKRGSWPSLFLSIDDVSAEAAIGSSPPKRTLTPAQRPPTTATESTASVSFDGEPQGTVKTEVGGNLTSNPDVFLSNGAFRKSVQALGLRYVRLATSRTVTPRRSGRAVTFDFSRLLSLVSAVRRTNAEPLICIDRNPSWRLSDAELSLLFDQALRTVNGAGRRPVNLWELLNKPTFGSSAMVIEEAVSLYDLLRTKSLETDLTLTTGGIGEASPWRPHLEMILNRATDLGFLSYQIYGTHNNSTSDADLVRSAREGISVDLPHQVRFSEIAELVQNSRFRQLPVFITETAPNSMQNPAGEATDRRLVSSLGAVWYAGLFQAAAPYVDAIFPYELTSRSWGLLDERGRAFPAYYSLWLSSTYFPPRSRLYSVEVSGDRIGALAARTKTACNVMLVNYGDNSTVCNLRVGGLKSLAKVRLRLLENKTPGVQFNELPAKPEQRVTLRGYSIVVLQFIE